MENEVAHALANGENGLNGYESQGQSRRRKIPDPPAIEFDPDPEELERVNRALSRQLSVKQLARLSLRHSVSRRGRSRSKRGQSDTTGTKSSAQEQPQAPQAEERPQKQRQSKIPDGPPPQLKFSPLELQRGGPSRSRKLSIIREAKAAEVERKKHAHEAAVRRSMKAENIRIE